jgi:hypothetical protein
MQEVASVADYPSPDPLVIYRETSTDRYLSYADGAWSEVPGGTLKKLLDDKAYIDMPNFTSFSFLNPRQWFFGVRTSFDLR